MDARNVVRRAADNGDRALTEDQAKQILSRYGIPVVTESVVADAAAATAAAAAMGYPVVLKAAGAALLHKADRGLVSLNLTDTDMVRHAAAEITAEAGDDLDGLLVQKQVRGEREFVAGMFRDPQFGPVVMFGIGGVFTEVLADVSFRLAPVTAGDVREMVTELRAGDLLSAQRGQRAVDMTAVTDTLIGLGRIAEEVPEIAEIDINPLIAAPDGALTAVDALIVPGAAPGTPSTSPPVDPAAIGSLFYPRSIAFIGASAQLGKWGNMLVSNTIAGGYRGDIYLVNPRGGTIAGRSVYRSVGDIAGSVDLAVVTVPASKVLDLIPQCRDKAIRNMLLITSGFGETGDAGKALEAELIDTAGAAGILILGPNTMGICNPHIDLYCTGSPVRPIAGSTAMWRNPETWAPNCWPLPKTRGSASGHFPVPATRP